MNTKRFYLMISMVFACINLNSQNMYATKSGHIEFFSDSPVEKIAAINRQVLSILDIQTNEVAVSVLMKSFDFEKALMQEHFNENYVESDKFPKAQFKGKIIDNINWSNEQEQVAEVKGQLTIHGKTRDVTVPVIISKKGNSIQVTGKFNVALKDYNIKVPSLVIQNIAENIEITLELVHKPLEK